MNGNYLKVIIYLIINFLSIFAIAHITHHYQNKKSSDSTQINIKDSTSHKDQKDKLIYNEKLNNREISKNF